MCRQEVRLLVATSNAGKLIELRRLLSDTSIQLVSLQDFPALSLPPEDGDSFAANARIKAEASAEASGYPAVADDSGLEVIALSGEPGIRSARYAGDSADDADNNRLLLSNMEWVEDRSARFICAVAYCRPGERAEVVIGQCHGQILRSPRGANGFGYDPLFYVPAEAKTFAELTLTEKNRISHRARALQAARPGLLTMLGRAGGG